MADRWPNADCLRDVFEALASQIPLVDRPSLPPKQIAPSSAAAIKKDLAEVRALVVNRHVLRMIEEMVNEEFPRPGSANDPGQQRSPLQPLGEKTPVSGGCESYLYTMPFSGFDLPFSTRNGASNAGRDTVVVPDVNSDELLTFPGVFDVDQWMLHSS